MRGDRGLGSILFFGVSEALSAEILELPEAAEPSLSHSGNTWVGRTGDAHGQTVWFPSYSATIEGHCQAAQTVTNAGGN